MREPGGDYIFCPEASSPPPHAQKVVTRVVGNLQVSWSTFGHLLLIASATEVWINILTMYKNYPAHCKGRPGEALILSCVGHIGVD